MTHRITVAAAALSVALLASACGGSSSPSSGATASDTTNTTTTSDGAPQSRLGVSESVLSFNDTRVTDQGARAVTITNVSAGRLVITAIAVDGAGFSASGISLPATLDPAQTANLTVGFAPATPGAASARISIASNDDSSLAVLTASGNGVDPTTSPPAETTPDTAGKLATPAFSWSKPDDFDGLLQTAISQQPSFMGGYGGQIPNPFPVMEGTAKFSGMQITRPDAVSFGNQFGRWAFGFFVDPQSKHSNGLRAEFTGESDYQFRDGDTYNYKFSTYFPSDYKNSSWTEWNMFAQFHGPGFPAWGLYTSGGYLHMTPPWAVENTYRIPMPAREQWHDFSWTIHWSPGSSGNATLSIDGVQVFDYSGATMHAGEPFYYPKFGSYLANNPYTQVTYTTPWVISRS